ncbi:MAG TPA: hypothetical protein VG148_00095 [Pyrinomonadaceae bacterium]|nr:hypothetical protein [Pyrinomonadaceae bacterium]
MLFYVALVLALTLAAAAGGLYFYVMFLDGTGRQLRRRVAELERANAALRAELRRRRQGAERVDECELWPEVIDEGGGLSLN